ncbi:MULTISPECIES: BTAD domain-containing putative transcriptional regulator [unclassified Streptomyces]|uniref:AfsR/SARP family transcriptional regulator n=1 Tax=unclassified Streptomyces TaxID=2593676 RepID=UPI0020250399|nr:MULTISPECIES: BTAD domain-containing putative transcriptional regulator [unclassified Streptomyces]MCX4553509.1 winged helix-turn-helix domain-containing protein [Streptomyces sp. NBC_01500]
MADSLTDSLTETRNRESESGTARESACGGGSGCSTGAALLRLTLLGPLRASRGGLPLPLGPLKQRLVLAVLLTRPNTPVSLEELTDAVWPDDPPRTARKNLQVYVSTLRRVLDPDDLGRLHHGPGGYVLHLTVDECDTLRFEELARRGDAEVRAGAPSRAARTYRQALDLWQYDPFSDLAAYAEVLRAAAERQHVRRLAVYEAWAEAQLETGDPAPVADTADEMVRRHPLRERLRAAQLTALHQVGRRTEALSAYDDCRQQLSRELGLEPGAALQGAYRSLLEDVALPRPRGGPIGSRLLPPELADFTGRTRELESVSALLGREGGPPVLLTGPAGVGKTAFAVHLAHRLAARYPDGVVTTRLCAEDGSTRPWVSVLAELARSLGCAERLPADREEAATVWRSWLSGRRILLLLDDAPDATALGPLLPPSGAAAALVTSRSRLSCLESAHRIELPPLSAEEALDLLGGIIGRPRLAAEHSAAARIAGATGLLPFALRAAGNRLSVLRHMTLGQYADRLEHPLEALDELASGGLGVRARLAGTWARLPAPARDTLHALAALADPSFTLPTAAGALGLDGRDAQRALENLIDVGVLSPPSLPEVTAHMAAPEAVCYELPWLTLLFAREQAAASGTRC